MQRQLDFSPAKRYHQFEQWQEKILQIGRELVERGEFLRSRRIKLSEEHTDFSVARKREQQIKDWNQMKKLKLINGQWTGQV